MRFLGLFIPTLFAACFPPVAWAQAEKKFQPPKIEKLHVGFQVHRDAMEQTAYKVGFWTPIYIEIFGGTDGIKAEANVKEKPHIDVETTDSDDVPTRIQIPVDVEPEQKRLYIGYVKTSHMSRNNQEVSVTLNRPNRPALGYRGELTMSSTLGNDSQIYLTLGSRLKDFHTAVVKMGQKPGAKERDFDANFDNTRLAAFETELTRLPSIWFGYNSVDLMILSTENRGFLTALTNDKEKLKAIAQWVRRGGRLVVPIARQNQQFVAALLQDEIAWQPPIPVVPPRAEGNLQYERLSGVAAWGGANDMPFQRKEKDPKNPLVYLPIPVATLDPGNVPPGDWEVLADSGADHRPLIARVRYGLGQITYVAFSFEDRAFFNWEGKTKFLENMVLNLAPPRPKNTQQNPNFGFGNQDDPNDLASQILALLDNFDVKVIPFGYVALFIVLYILVVGPLDFFLLKYVFKRLEWTWITFPSVVLAVSVIAYFAAYALKGRDMKINKIDIVDFDLRTSLDGARSPQNVHAYGHSFFTILSPRIQNYTVGLEPNPAFWGEKPGKALNVDLLSWLGRPTSSMNMGRGGGGTSSLFRRPYDYVEDVSGVKGVPIPVWTTKAFTASWEQTLPKPPFVVNLVYYQKKEDVKIAGKLENHLGVDLVDAWLIYDKRAYPLDDALKSVSLGAEPRPISIAPEGSSEMKDWFNHAGNKDDAADLKFNPISTIKSLLFHETFNISLTSHNHLLRTLDLGWRVKKEEGPRGGTREAILVARVKSTGGPADSIQRDPKNPTATRLWLGELPDIQSDRQPPTLAGHMNQCTFIRAILPLKAAEE